jgi:hypothetical protein
MTYFYTVEEGGLFYNAHCKRKSKQRIVEQVRNISSDFSIVFKNIRYDEPLRKRGLNPWTRLRGENSFLNRHKELVEYFKIKDSLVTV